MGGGVLVLAKSPRPIHARARATRFVISAKRRCFYARVFPRASTVRAEPAFKLTGPGSAALAAYESRLRRVGVVL